MKSKKLSTRRYSKTSPDNPARKKFVTLYALGDPKKKFKPSNGTRSYMAAYGESRPEIAKVRASELVTNRDVQLDIEEQRKKLEAVASKAVLRLDQHVDSEDERISLDASKYAVDQVHGKATQKVEHRGVFVTGYMNLAGDEAPPQEIIDQLNQP